MSFRLGQAAVADDVTVDDDRATVILHPIYRARKAVPRGNGFGWSRTSREKALRACA